MNPHPSTFFADKLGVHERLLADTELLLIISPSGATPSEVQAAAKATWSGPAICLPHYAAYQEVVAHHD